jgi:hypothetical protein
MQTPQVLTLTDRRGIPTLQSQRLDCAKPDFAIKGLEPDKQLVLRVPLERVYGLLN